MTHWIKLFPKRKSKDENSIAYYDVTICDAQWNKAKSADIFFLGRENRPISDQNVSRSTLNGIDLMMWLNKKVFQAVFRD